MSTTMTVRLEDDIKNRLEQLADSTQRSKSASPRNSCGKEVPSLYATFRNSVRRASPTSIPSRSAA